MPLSRATVIGTSGFESEATAASWLERCRKNEREREQVTAAALAIVNRALHGHRVADFDPYVRDISRSQARAVRLGYGTGDEVVEGYWKDAYNLPGPSRGARSGRRQMLAPQEELAGILSGRRPVHVSEDLVLRARLDLDQGRPEQAALQLRAGAGAFVAELRAGEGGDGAAAALEALAGAARELAGAALAGELAESQVTALVETIEQTERLLRRRRHSQAKNA